MQTYKYHGHSVGTSVHLECFLRDQIIQSLHFDTNLQISSTTVKLIEVPAGWGSLLSKAAMNPHFFSQLGSRIIFSTFVMSTSSRIPSDSASSKIRYRSWKKMQTKLKEWSLSLSPRFLFKVSTCLYPLKDQESVSPLSSCPHDPEFPLTPPPVKHNVKSWKEIYTLNIAT